MRLERKSEARRDAPLASGKGSVADTLRPVRVIARNDEAGTRNHIGNSGVAVLGRLEIVNTSVFLRQAAVPVVAQPGRDAESGKDLVLILNIEPGLVGTIVAVGITLKKGSSNKAIRRIRGHPVHGVCRKVGRGHVALTSAQIADVELRIGIVAAKRDGVIALRPDGTG